MILDTNVLKDGAKVTNQYVVGKANKTQGMLKENELVMLFNGVQTALHYIKDNLSEPIPGNGRSSLSGGGHRGNSFSSYDEAMETFTKHPEKVVNYDPTEMRPIEFDEQGNDLEYDVTGDFIDVGRVLEGVPEHFGSLHNGNARNRRVRIVVGLSQAHWMEPGDIDHRSERVIRLVDALENARVRTEVITVSSGRTSHVETLVKRFDESLVIEDVAVATHSEFFRRMMFRASECSDTQEPMGYGDSEVLIRNVKTLESQLNDELSVYIDSNIRGKKTIDDRFNKLEELIETELSETVPSTNLVWVTSSNVNTSQIQS